MPSGQKTCLVSILIALGAGGLSAFLIRNSVCLYDIIRKPALSPPAVLFPVVWTVLYILMGISSARIYLQKPDYAFEVMDTLLNYALQLILNVFWPVIFFNIQTFFFALIWLVVLWCLIIKVIFRFSRLDTVAAYLQIPYFLWVTYAGYLNFMIYLMN